MSLRRNTGWALLATVGPAPLALLSTVVLARALSPADHGQLQAALALLVLATTLGNAGFVAATIHRVRAASRPPAEALGVGLLGVSVAGSVLATGLWLGSPWVRSQWLLGADPMVLGAVICLLAPTLWGAVAGGLARGLDCFALWTRLEWLGRAGRLGAWSLLWAAGLAEPVTLLLAAAVMELVVVGAAGWGLRDVGRPTARVDELVAAVRFGLPASLTAVAGQLHERLDIFLLAMLRGDPVEIAVYAVAVGVINRLRMVPLAVASALFPAVAGADPEEGVRLASQASRVSLAASLAGAVAVLAVAPWVVPWLFGEVYAEAVWLMAVLAPGTVAYSLYLVLARWFQGVDQQRVNVGALAVAGLVNVGLNLWWIPTHGALGAAAASAVSYGLQGLLVLLAFVWRAGASPWSALIPRRTDLAWWTS